MNSLNLAARFRVVRSRLATVLSLGAARRGSRFPTQVPHVFCGLYGPLDGPRPFFSARVGAAPREFRHVAIPKHSYAIFAIEHNITTIQRVLHTIWNQWLPASGYKAAKAPAVECYHENFDPQTGDGGFEIWVAIEP